MRAVPLQVEAFPPRPEEGVEGEVVVLLRALDAILVVEVQRLCTDRAPVVAERGEVGQLRDIEVGLVRHRREQVGEDVVRRHEGRVVGQLAHEPEPLAPAVVHGDRARDDDPEHDHARRGKRRQDVGEREVHQALRLLHPGLRGNRHRVPACRPP